MVTPIWCLKLNFTGTDGTLLSAQYSGAVKSMAGDVEIKNNGFRATAAGTVGAYHFPDSVTGTNRRSGVPPKNQYARCVVRDNGANLVGLIVRKAAGTTETMYMGFLTGTNALTVAKRIAGVQTSLGTATFTVNVGDELTLMAYQNVITLLVNGSSQISVSNSDIASGFPGLITSKKPTNEAGDLYEAGLISVPPIHINTHYLRRRRRKAQKEASVAERLRKHLSGVK